VQYPWHAALGVGGAHAVGAVAVAQDALDLVERRLGGRVAAGDLDRHRDPLAHRP
jgi:hypothetical protein